ncbi:hypothetical protein JHK84_050093 [Glycine max]|nr:hypothetical protein JHK85_050820 [Glycine max]KAG5094505.1 hypothetical protein JHK84_050093 [Glycine max]
MTLTLASESLFRYLTPPLEKELRNNGRSLLTDQTKKNLVRTFGTHSGARVKFPSITKVYGSDQEFNVKVNYHGRKFRNTRIQIAIGGSTEEECKGNGCIMTKTRSRYASSVPRKRGWKPLNIDRYDGTKNNDEHLEAYIAQESKVAAEANSEVDTLEVGATIINSLREKASKDNKKIPLVLFEV